MAVQIVQITLGGHFNNCLFYCKALCCAISFEGPSTIKHTHLHSFPSIPSTLQIPLVWINRQSQIMFLMGLVNCCKETAHWQSSAVSDWTNGNRQLQHFRALPTGACLAFKLSTVDSFLLSANTAVSPQSNELTRGTPWISSAVLL